MLSIGQVARLMKVHSQTLRNWEKEGLVSPKRIGQLRVYSQNDIRLCKFIKRHSGHGISLQTIKYAIKNEYNNNFKKGGAA